jgi:hypothetical protein
MSFASLLVFIMIKIICSLLIMLPFSMYGQSPKSLLLKDINRDVWLPFLEGVNTDKDELYIAVHANTFYWVKGGSQTRIMNFKEYEDDSRMVMGKRRKQGILTKIDVRFVERVINAEFAAETCVFKYTSEEKNKQPQIAYNMAKIFSHKENGVWKMVIQSVHNEAVTEETYQQADVLEKTE